MRERDARDNGRTGKLIRPRYMVWENVEGAKTSPGGEHRGEDYAAVIEEIIRIVEPDADIRVRVPDGGWPNAGCYYAEDGRWSIAYRLVDAQYFGTPQRRVRIALLADLGGSTAPWIMFDPQFERTTENGEPVETVADTFARRQTVSSQSARMQGHPQSREPKGEGTACGIESSAGVTDGCLNGWDIQSKHVQSTDGIAEPLYAGECRYGGGESYLLDDQAGKAYTLKIRGGVEFDSDGRRAGKGPLVQTELSGTLGVSQDQTLIRTAYGLDQQGGKGGANYTEEVSPPILSDSHGTPHAVCGINGDIAGTLDASYYKGCGERQGIEREVVMEAVAVDAYNHTTTGDVAVTVTAASGSSPTHSGPMVLETQEAVPYGICSYESNAFRSPNPHSAIYKADTSRALDNNCGNPACNQGGIAIVEAIPIEGNGARPSHFGNGYGKPGDPSFTLNHVEQHAVATYDARGNGDGDVCCTLTGDHQDRVTDYTALVVENDTAGE